jgi:DNA polymerase-3 subunit beta
MKFTAAAGALAKACKVAAGALDEKTRFAILRNVLLTAESGSVTVTATDRDVMISANADTIAIEPPGAITVPGEGLRGIVGNLGADVAVTLETVDKALFVRANRSRFRLPTLPAPCFPRLEAPDTNWTLQLDRATRGHLFDAPLFCVVDDGTAGYRAGVYLHCNPDDGLLCSCATDGHKLALAKSTLAADGLPDRGIIVAKKIAEQICKLPGDVFRVRASERLVEVATDSVSLVSKLIDGTFPNFYAVLPQPSGNQAVVSRKDLLASLKRLRATNVFERLTCALSWDSGADSIRLTLADGALADDAVVATTTGTGAITLSVMQMVEITDNLASDELTLSVFQRNQPLRIDCENFVVVLAAIIDEQTQGG